MSYTKEKAYYKFGGLIIGYVLSNHLTSPLYNNVFESATLLYWGIKLLMSIKRIRCFTYDLKRRDKTVDSKYLKDVIEELFESKNVKTVSYMNKAFIFKDNDEENYLSLEYLKHVDDIDVNDNYLFFRIGREKDIEGAIKRNLETFEGKEIIDKEDQDSYNLEICTYILVDIKDSIVLELYGQYAPTVKSFKHILNKSFSNNEFDYKKIVSEELINALSDEGVRLNKIRYNYEVPSADILTSLGLDDVQIQQIRNLDFYQIEVTLKARNHVPLTTSSQKIKHTINALRQCTEKIKNTLRITGKTKNTSSKDYTFREEDVTFNLDIPSVKVDDGLSIKLSLDEIAKEVYYRMKNLYEGENKARVLSYIEK
ncbi:hypothetical protein ACSVC9_10270 [Clostridium sp. LBM24168]